MKELTESLFFGTWRSYKAFLNSGNVKNHTKDTYLEFVFNDDRQLSISSHEHGKMKKLYDTKDWKVFFKDKRHYLSIGGKGEEYEIITINHVALVLMDTQTMEKYFCARLPTWETYVKSPAATVL